MRVLILPLLVFALWACGSDDNPAVDSDRRDPTTTSIKTESSTTTVTTDPAAVDARRIAVTVAGGQPEGGVRTEKVRLGEEVLLVVTADVKDQVHVHGYDLTLDLVPGQEATLAFAADLPGVWEVELHDAGNVIVELQVS